VGSFCADDAQAATADPTRGGGQTEFEEKFGPDAGFPDITPLIRDVQRVVAHATFRVTAFVIIVAPPLVAATEALARGAWPPTLFDGFLRFSYARLATVGG
jgi:hypothetical protein